MKVFVDTSAFVALQIQNDRNHLSATQYFKALKQKRSSLFTSDYVLAETYTRLIYDTHLGAAETFHKIIVDLLEAHQLTLLEVDSTEREQSWEELRRYEDHKLSFTDATIVVQFKEYQLDEIFTFDSDFRNINLPTNL